MNHLHEAANPQDCFEQAPSKATTNLTGGLDPEQERRWASVVARAWDDEEFRQRLLTRPAEVLREAGLDVPDDAEVEVVDREPEGKSEGVTCLRLPPRPAEEDLIEECLGVPEAHSHPVGKDQ